MKTFGEKEAWAYPGTAQIISGTGKGSDFKFGQHIQRVHPNIDELDTQRTNGCKTGTPPPEGGELMVLLQGGSKFVSGGNAPPYGLRGGWINP